MEQLGSPFSRRTFLVGSGAAAVGVGLAAFAPAQRALAAQTVLPKFTYGPQDKLASFYAQRDRAGSEKATILMLGDSLTEGYGTKTLQEGYPAQVRKMLRAQFSSSAGTGIDYVAARHQIFKDGAPAWNPPLFTYTGPIVEGTRSGLGRRCVVLDPTSVGTLAGQEFTSFKLAWRARTAASTIKVKIGTGTWIAVPASPAGEKTYLSSSLPAGVRQIQIKQDVDAGITSADRVEIEGVWLFNGDENRNIHVIEGGRSGSATWEFSAASNGLPATGLTGDNGWADAIDRFAPSLVTMAWGTNDVRQKNQAQIQTETSRVISLIRAHTAAPILIIVPFRPVVENNFKCSWADLRTGLAAVAEDTRTVDYFDVGQYMTFGLNNDPNGWGLKDRVHLTEKGYEEMARVISAKLSAVPA